MSDLIEVVLEKIPKENVCALLFDLAGRAEKISNGYSLDDIIFFIDGKLISEKLIEAIDFSQDFCLFLELKNLSIGASLLKSLLLRVVKYENFYDIDFSFDSNDVAFAWELEELADALKVLKVKYGINKCFAGVEPALLKDKSSLYFVF